MKINNNIKRIHIIGTLGSGKSYLAKELSTKFNIPYFELDDIFWKKKGIKEEKTIMIEKLNLITSQEKWVVEGVFSSFVKNSIINADLVIWLKPNPNLITLRLIKREIFQKILSFKKPGRFLHLIKFARNYYNKDDYYYEHKNLLEENNINYYLIENNKDKKKLIQKLEKISN